MGVSGGRPSGGAVVDGDSLCAFSAAAESTPASLGSADALPLRSPEGFHARFVFHLLCRPHVRLDRRPAFLLFFWWYYWGSCHLPGLLVELFFHDSYCSVQVLPNNLKKNKSRLHSPYFFPKKITKDTTTFENGRCWIFSPVVISLGVVFLTWRCFPQRGICVCISRSPPEL